MVRVMKFFNKTKRSEMKTIVETKAV
jgi:hypothetical protein